MNLLIDIGHPAHVHYYRNLATEMEAKGHKVFWTVKDLESAKKLLDFYGFSYVQLPHKKDGLFGKIFNQLTYDFILLKFCKKHKIDLAIGTSVTIAHVSKISKVRSVVLDDDDDEVQPLVTKYVHPFANTILSPDVLRGKRKRSDTIYYPGYHELAYLHPGRFTPDPNVMKEAGLIPGEPFFIMRFNVFKAHHDVGIKGLSLQQKLKLIEILKPHGKILITTERDIEPELKEYQLKISPEKAHSLMSFAKIFLGDSQTMTSEAAVLGVPSLRCNSFAGRISYLEEEEKKYGLTFAFLPKYFDNFVTKLNEMLAIPDLKQEWQQRRQKMLNDKIDVTAFWLWFIENYPTGISEVNDNVNFWSRFK
jgi:uncharacterized protein